MLRRRFNSKSIKQQWQSLPSPSTPRTSCGVASLASLIVVVGGKDANYESLKSVEVYNGDLGSWYALPNLLIPRSRCTALVHHDKLYVFGGVDKSDKYLGSVEVLDLNHPEWGFKLLRNSMPLALSHVVAVSYTDTNAIFLVGGWDGETHSDAVWKLDVEWGQFTKLPPMRVPRRLPAVTICDDNLVIAGGEAAGFQWQAIVEVFDLRDEEFFNTYTLPDLPQALPINYIDHEADCVLVAYTEQGTLKWDGADWKFTKNRNHEGYSIKAGDRFVLVNDNETLVAVRRNDKMVWQTPNSKKVSTRPDIPTPSTFITFAMSLDDDELLANITTRVQWKAKQEECRMFLSSLSSSSSASERQAAESLLERLKTMSFPSLQELEDLQDQLTKQMRYSIRKRMELAPRLQEVEAQIALERIAEQVSRDSTIVVMPKQVVATRNFTKTTSHDILNYCQQVPTDSPQKELAVKGKITQATDRDVVVRTPNAATGLHHHQQQLPAVPSDGYQVHFKDQVQSVIRPLNVAIVDDSKNNKKKRARKKVLIEATSPRGVAKCDPSGWAFF